MAECLANEILDAGNGLGASIKRARRHAEDGRVEQGLRPLPLVVGTTPDPPGVHPPGCTPTTTGPARSFACSETTETMADAKRTHPLERTPQHRDHGPHRRGQDHDDRAHPLLHRQELQDRRGPRGRGRHGLDGAGAGARHHHHVRRHHLPVARPHHQHHRHARPRRLHRRGRALAPRARRRRRRVRRRGRRRAADRDRVAPGRQVRRPAHVLRQQDGPHSAPTSHCASTPSRTASAPTSPSSSCRSAPRATTRASSTSST